VLELFTLEFLYALAAIVVIDLVLAGDNAIVIALAARNVPRHLQTRAIIWGAAGAIVVRSTMTSLVVWLLNIPGLLFAGGAMLVWIAYKLLLPENQANGGTPKVNTASTFMGAIRTIVVADMVMGLDNVLGVAGAAHGSFLLVVMGLLISVPVVIWGSTLLLQFVERFPAFVYLGAGVLAVTAVNMMTAEPLLKGALAGYKVTVPLLYLVTVSGVLWAGFVKNHRRLESRISAHLARYAQQRASGEPISQPLNGENAMLNVLVPVDSSRNSRRAVQHVINESRQNAAIEVQLLNVQRPFSRHIARFVAKKSRDDYHREQSEKVLVPIKKMFDNAGVRCTTHHAVGNKARLITQTAARLNCDHIVMSTARKNSLTRMVEDSTTNRVLELTKVPVEVIAGDAVSKLERFGIPAGIAAALGLLLFAAAD
jgi:YjbE family integral membrane protein